MGADQLARSILVLSDGKISEVISIAEDFMGDPRDVINAAERKIGNPGHFFNLTFDEIDKIE